MTIQQIQDLITGDPEATKLANEGRDYEVSLRISAIAPIEVPIEKVPDIKIVATADEVSLAWAKNRKEGFIK